MDLIGRDPQYDDIADRYLRHAIDGFYNAHLDRPACLALLGDVNGRTVLDAACGPGLYARELLARGAEVVGVDQSSRMVELARAGAPQAEFRVHDLADPLPFPDSCFDAVLLALAYEYLDDAAAVFTEFRRVLRADGAFVLSRPHPTADWLRHPDSDYFADRVVEEIWQTDWHMRFRMAPLERTTEQLFAAGFLIERLWEPRPAPSGRAVDPDRYARKSTEPTGFVALRALPRPGTQGGPTSVASVPHTD